MSIVFFFQAEDGIRDTSVTGVQTCALPIWHALACGYIKPKIGRLKYAPPHVPLACAERLEEAGNLRPVPFNQSRIAKLFRRRTLLALVHVDPQNRNLNLADTDRKS